MNKNRAIINKKNLTKIMNFWQERLRLNWRILINIEPRLPDNIRGRCYWEGSLQDATILINPNIDWSKYPVEKTVLHELLHLLFAKLGDPCPDCIETAVKILTDVLYNGKK